MNEKILITGGTGFLGNNLVRNLIGSGKNIIVWGRSEIENSSLKDLKDQIDYQEVDLLEENLVKEKLLELAPDYIVHLSVNNEPGRDSKLIKDLIRDNVETTLNLYLAAKELKALNCLIALGSAAEYELNELPFNEEQIENPASSYGLSKVFLSRLSDYFFKNFNLPITVIKPTQIYGEYQSKGLVPTIITKCLNNENIETTPGDQTKDFIYVQDVVKAINLILSHPEKTNGENIIICTGKETKTKEVIHLIKDFTGSTSTINFGAINYREGENLRFFASNQKAKRLLGWEPQFSLEGGLRRTVEWYRKQH